MVLHSRLSQWPWHLFFCFTVGTEVARWYCRIFPETAFYSIFILLFQRHSTWSYAPLKTLQDSLHINRKKKFSVQQISFSKWFIVKMTSSWECWQQQCLLFQTLVSFKHRAKQVLKTANVQFLWTKPSLSPRIWSGVDSETISTDGTQVPCPRNGLNVHETYKQTDSCSHQRKLTEQEEARTTNSSPVIPVGQFPEMQAVGAAILFTAVGIH